MSEIDDLLLQAEARVTSNSGWNVLLDYPVKEFYTDDGGYVQVIDRTLDDLGSEKSVSEEEMSQYIEIRMNRYYDGVDLIEMAFHIYFCSEDEQLGDTSTPVNVYYSDDEIKFGWAVPKYATQIGSPIKVTIFADGTLPDGSTYLWRTVAKTYRIEQSVQIGSGIVKPSENWFLEFEEIMDQKVLEVRGYSQTASTAASTASTAATTASSAASVASAAKTVAVTAQEKAQKVLDELPEDYTDLSDHVERLDAEVKPTGKAETHIGKNLCDSSNAVIGVSWNSDLNPSRGYIETVLKKGKKYTCSLDSLEGFTSVNIFWMKNKTTATPEGNYSLLANNKTQFTFTVPDECEFVRFLFGVNGSISKSVIESVHPQIEEGLTATEYEPFHWVTPLVLEGSGDSPISSFHLKGRSEQTPTVTMGSLNWQKSSSGDGRFYADIANGVPHCVLTCSKYPYADSHNYVSGKICSGDNGNGLLRVFVADTAYATADAFKSGNELVTIGYEGTPTPTNPIPIIDSSGVIEAKNKNLWDWNGCEEVSQATYLDGLLSLNWTGAYTCKLKNADKLYIDLDSTKTYTLSAMIKGNSVKVRNGSSTTLITSNATSGFVRYAATISGLSQLEIHIVRNDSTGAAQVKEVMLEEGTSASEYVEYKSNTIAIGNVFSIEKMGEGTVIDAYDGHISMYAQRGSSDFITMAEGQKMYFSSTADIDVNVHWYDANKNWMNSLKTWNFIKDGFEFIQRSGASYIRFSFRTKTDDAITKISTKTYGIKVYIDNMHIDLRSIPNTEIADTLTVNEDGSGELIQKAGVVNLVDFIDKGNPAINNGAIQARALFPADNKGKDISLSNRFVFTATHTSLGSLIKNGEFGYNTSGMLTLKMDGFTTVKDYQDFFAANETILYYELATPIVTKLTKEQVLNILSLRTYAPQTIVDAGDIAQEYSVGYYTNTPAGAAGGSTADFVKEMIKESYSSEEVQIGYWTDGKPLYRRVIQTTTPSNAGYDVVVSNLINGNSCNIKSISGSIKYSDVFTFPISYYWANSNNSIIYIDSDGIHMSVSTVTNKPCEIIVEYTKK